MDDILIVEDDRALSQGIRLGLEGEGRRFIQASTLAQGERALEERTFSLVVLDLNLPDGSGLELLRRLRARSALPVLILTANDLELDQVTGLELGADDYMTKPFSVSELLARVEALCRRVSRSGGGSAADESAPTTLVSGEFVLDENRRVLLKAGRQIELTQVEFQIMELFFHNPGIALVREKILKGVWGENYFGDVKIVDVNIRRLRMKVEDEPSHPTHIMTVWGYGYRWEE